MIAEQLQLRGVEAYTTRDLGKLGASDAEQFQTAIALNAVLVTHDMDFLQLQATQTLFIKEQQFGIGFIVRVLEQIARHCNLSDFTYVCSLQEFTHPLPADEWKYNQVRMVIERREGVVGGKPAIADTRIKVSQIVLRYLAAGERVSEIVRRYPHLTPAQVHTAIAYFYEHPEEILAELYEELRLIDAKLSEDDRQRLRSQLTMLMLEGYQFRDLIETPEQAQEASGVYLRLREIAKSEYLILEVGAADSVRAALQNITDAADCYAVRYAPIEQTQAIAEQIRQ